jgi:Ca2+-binding RTX toxin-like protein
VATISWISTIGGDWSDPSNWQGSVVPGAADDAVMKLSNAETVTISSLQLVDNVSFEDPAATIVETTSGTLTASGDVTLVAASINVAGELSAGLVSFGAGALPGPSPLLMPATLSGVTINIGGSILAPLPVEDPGDRGFGGGAIAIHASPVNVTPDLNQPRVIVPDNFPAEAFIADSITLSQPIAAFASSSPANLSPMLTPIIFTLPASACGDQFLRSGDEPLFLHGGLAPTWGGLDPSPRSFASGPQTVFGAGEGAILSANGFRSEVLAAGAGNETLVAGAGSDTCVAGTGTTQMIGGSGSATFLFSNGEAGGSVDIANFVPGQDFVALRNHGSAAVQDALVSASVEAGSTTITLGDNSRITFAGLANLTRGDFR